MSEEFLSESERLAMEADDELDDSTTPVDDDDDPADEDDPGQEAGEKSGKLSLKARATLAMIALNGADKENAR